MRGVSVFMSDSGYPVYEVLRYLFARRNTWLSLQTICLISDERVYHIIAGENIHAACRDLMASRVWVECWDDVSVHTFSLDGPHASLLRVNEQCLLVLWNSSDIISVAIPCFNTCFYIY